jgi:hypothetical protein
MKEASGQELFIEMTSKQRLLERSLGELGKRGRVMAEAEKEYRIALKKKMAEYRTNGYPVTIMGDMCRGDEEVARLKFERDIAEVDYQANMEAINVFKLSVRTLENQIDREWSRSK